MDADWVGSKEDRRSTLGYCLFVRGGPSGSCLFVGGNLDSWKSKKQSVVS